MTVSEQDTDARRADMVRDIERCMEQLGTAAGYPTLSPAVREAIAALPRHAFIAETDAAAAYLNRPLAIGYGQTISQPFVVALMTELLALGPDARVLEVGTGSGYQTAVLARLAAWVFTIEICAPLAQRAQATFSRLGIENISARLGDGSAGWPSQAPFDAILVAAAPPAVPEPLIRQLRPGGRLVMPVGESAQQLIVVEKLGDQSTVTREIIPVCFVPLMRQDPPAGDA